MDAQLTFGAAGGSFRAGDCTLIGTVHPPDLRLRMHDHEAATIVVVQRGEFEERVGSRPFRCTPGSILIKPAGAHHSNHYDGAGSTAILAALPDWWSVRDVALFRDAAAARRLAFELRARDAASSLVCESLLLELLQQRPGPGDWRENSAATTAARRANMRDGRASSARARCCGSRASRSRRSRWRRASTIRATSRTSSAASSG